MNVSLSTTEAISLACQFFQEGLPMWAKPLVYRLEQSQPQLALKWSLRLFEDRLVRLNPAESRNRYQQWLDGLSNIIEQTDVAEYCDRFAHEIWNKTTNLDVYDRGVARLYWAMKNFLCNLSSDYNFQITSAVNMVAWNDDSLNEMDETTLRLAISLFSILIQELPV